MLDRSIPYYNIILRWDGQGDIPQAPVPPGFSLRGFQPGDERAWAALEHEIGDFASPEEAEAYFRATYCAQEAALKARCILATDARGRVVGACIAWRDMRGAAAVASLHWLAVSPACQGKGLGKALCRETLRIFQALGETPVYLHTQPWSHRAVLLYHSMGFRIQKTESFSHYENQYGPAMRTLRTLLPAQAYAALEARAE